MNILVTGGAGFIGSYLIEKLLKDSHHVSALDNMSTGRYKNIEPFQNNKNLYKEGVTTLGKNIEAKKTTDITIAPKDLEKPKFEIFKKYFNELHKCYVDYQQQWPFVKSIFGIVDVGVFNIQKYNPGDHFSHLHCERTSLNSLHRLFAFMTYLNNVESGGETYFNHYKIKIKRCVISLLS